MVELEGGNSALLRDMGIFLIPITYRGCMELSLC